MGKNAICATVGVISAALGLTIGHYASRYDGMKHREDVSWQIQTLAVDSDAIPIRGSAMIGSAQAKATIVVFVDFSAPAVSVLRTEVLDPLFKVHGDDVAVVYKHMPLAGSADGMERAQAAAAAARQKAFWPMATRLESAPAPFTLESAKRLAQELGLNVVQFERDYGSREVRDEIHADLALAHKLKIHEAPAVFVNGRRVVFGGAIEIGPALALVNAEIARVRTLLYAPGGMYYISSIMNEQIAASSHDSLGRPARGAQNPLVTIEMFSDYECPFCARVEPTIARILRAYPDTVRVVFNQHPLGFHAHAREAALAAIAADRQGKFWEMHDILFANSRRLDDIPKLARQAGLNMEQFERDRKSQEVADFLAANESHSEEWGIQGTPSFLINGIPVVGAMPYNKFASEIDSALKKARDLHTRTGLSGEALYREIMKNAPKHQQVDDSPVFVDAGNSYARGPENAPVQIIIFSEFQCPFCGRAEPTLDEVRKKYGDQVRFVFKNFPLAFHKDAKLASEAALAAGAQGKFWEMHDILFQNQKALGRGDLSDYAKQIGLDVAAFDRDLDSHRFAAQVESEMKQGEEAGVDGTPAFFINGKRLVGAQPFTAFDAAIQKALKEIKR